VYRHVHQQQNLSMGYELEDRSSVPDNGKYSFDHEGQTGTKAI
jgi:hypothetical protein